MSLFDKHILGCYYICHSLNSKNTFISKILMKIINKYYSFILKFLYGSFMPYKAKLGSNINFIHSFHGIFISQNAIIGDNCTILHHVTIGSNIQKKSNSEAPIIGDNVFIGCNVCIIGKTVIEDNCKIGAGSVIVNEIIKQNETVIMQNTRISK